MLFHAVHTEPPPPRTFRAGVPPDLETICLKAMAKRPEDRYADCQELADDLRRWLEGEPVKARPLTPRERLARWLRKNPGLARAAGVTAASLALLALVGGLGSVGMAALARHEEEARQHAESAREAEAEAQGKAIESHRAAARAKEEIERDNEQAAAALARAEESSRKAEESQRKAEETRREEDRLLAAAREADRAAAEALAKAEEAGNARRGGAPQGHGDALAGAPNPYFVGGNSNVYAQIFRRDFPNYSAGVSLNIPFRNRQAQADYVTDQLQFRQTELQLQRAVNQVRVDVKTKLINLQQARSRYETAVATRVSPSRPSTPSRSGSNMASAASPW